MKKTNTVGISKLWDTYPIRGAYYHKDVDASWKRLKSYIGKDLNEDELILEREPTNRYDCKAIRVLDRDTGKHIGFVPAASNHQLAILMDNCDVEVTAKVDKSSDFTSHKLFMQVYIRFPVATKVEAETAFEATKQLVQRMMYDHLIVLTLGDEDDRF